MRQARFDSSRLAALSDGVFAIALTLLVLDLKLPALDPLNLEPEATGEFTERALLRQLPHFLAWVLSFAILARLWIVQHALLVGGGHRSRAFMGWNFAFLAAVSVIPFTTALIAEHRNNPWSVVVFSLTLIMGGIALDRMWSVERSFFVQQALTNRAVTSPRSSTILMLVITVVACLAGWAAPRRAPFVWMAFPLLAPLLHRIRDGYSDRSDSK